MRGDVLTPVISVSGAGGSCSAPFFTPAAGLGLGSEAPLSAPRPTSLGPGPKRGAACFFRLVFPPGREGNKLCIGCPQGRCGEGAAGPLRVRGCSERSGPTRAAEHCGRSGLSPSWPRASDKRDPDSGLFTGKGVRDCCLGRSEYAAEEVRHTACHGKEGPTSVPSWDQGSPQACPGSETSGHGNGAVPQSDTKGMDLEMHNLTRLCPCPGISWSTLGLPYAWPSPLSRRGLSRETHWKGICFGGFLIICMPGLCTWLSQCSPSITCISHGSEKTECSFQCT